MADNDMLEEILEELKLRKNDVADAPKPEPVKEKPKEEYDLWNDFVPPTEPKVEPVADDAPIFVSADEPAEELPQAPELEKADAPLEADMVDFSTKRELEPEEDEYEESQLDGEKAKKNNAKKKGIIIAIIVFLVAIAVGVGVYFATHKKAEPNMKPAVTEVQTTQSKLGPVNPLTGEAGYDEKLLTQRPIAVVVENEYSTESVKPQWGIDQADIVLEGESEYSTRMLMFWANFNDVPDQVGPARSARPPFIRFSELFDAIFIHAGLSNTANGYIGADTVFEEDNVDHINLLHTAEDGKYFGRDYSRTSVVEHTGYLNGKNVAEMLEAYKFNTQFEPANFTQLKFNEKAKKLSKTEATSVKFRWNVPEKDGRCPKTASFTYNADNDVYTTTDFDSSYGEANVKWTNLIFLLDETEYIEKTNYKGSGQSEIYCNYLLSGGKGTVVSNGTAVEITWGVDNGKLWIKDEKGKDLKLNPGKSYIGYGSSNKGGYVELNPESNTQE